MIKKRYVLKKEIREELLNLCFEVLGIMCLSGIILLLLLVNGILF